MLLNKILMLASSDKCRRRAMKNGMRQPQVLRNNVEAAEVLLAGIRQSASPFGVAVCWRWRGVYMLILCQKSAPVVNVCWLPLIN